jgi:NADPH:quinone reductase
LAQAPISSLIDPRQRRFTAYFESKVQADMKAIVFDEVGAPRDVLRLTEVPVPEVADNEVLIRMVAASISPGDFLFVRGLYPPPHQPTLPRQIAGTHGIGIVERCGKRAAMPTGSLVALDAHGTWAEYVSVPADWLAVLPPDYPVEKGAQLFNIITAWDLLADANAQPGQWVAVTGGNSSLGSMVTQFAAARGIRIISLVRQIRTGWHPSSLGSTEAVELTNLSVPLADKVRDLTGGNGLNSIIDCVGGPAVGDLIRGAALHCQVIVYGGMSPSPSISITMIFC